MFPALTAAGIDQARALASILAGEPIESLYSSDLCRALQTAEPIGQSLGLEVRVDSRLRERALGIAEGTPSALLRADRSGIAGGRVVDADAAPEGGESIRQFYRRASECAGELLRAPDGGDVVLVCHGGVVRVLLAWLEGITPDEMAWQDVANCDAIACPIACPIADPVLAG